MSRFIKLTKSDNGQAVQLQTCSILSYVSSPYKPTTWVYTSVREGDSNHCWEVTETPDQIDALMDALNKKPEIITTKTTLYRSKNKYSEDALNLLWRNTTEIKCNLSGELVDNAGQTFDEWLATYYEPAIGENKEPTDAN